MTNSAVMIRILILVCSLAQLPLSTKSALPAEWKTCKKDDNRDNCLRDAINGALQTLVNGNKKLGVLPTDPMKLGVIKTRGDPKGAVALEITFKDFVLHNIKNLVIRDVKLKGRVLKFNGTIDGALEIRSPYTVSGRILSLPITGDGPSVIRAWNGTYTFDLYFREKPEIKNGKQYLVVEKFVQHSYPKKLDISLENLFNGNKQLGDTMNKVLNDNWELVWSELKPLFEEGVSEAFLQLSNRVFSKVPMDEIGLL